MDSGEIDMNRIREWRIAHGLTQKQVCEIVGMPKRTLENWEEENRKPPEWIENLVLEKLEREH